MNNRVVAGISAGTTAVVLALIAVLVITLGGVHLSRPRAGVGTEQLRETPLTKAEADLAILFTADGDTDVTRFAFKTRQKHFSWWIETRENGVLTKSHAAGGDLGANGFNPDGELLSGTFTVAWEAGNQLTVSAQIDAGNQRGSGPQHLDWLAPLHFNVGSPFPRGASATAPGTQKITPGKATLLSWAAYADAAKNSFSLPAIDRGSAAESWQRVVANPGSTLKPSPFAVLLYATFS